MVNIFSTRRFMAEGLEDCVGVSSSRLIVSGIREGGIWLAAGLDIIGGSSRFEVICPCPSLSKAE
jgi:hypothetical protein